MLSNIAFSLNVVKISNTCLPAVTSLAFCQNGGQNLSQPFGIHSERTKKNQFLAVHPPCL
jgi:hypothetical protein